MRCTAHGNQFTWTTDHRPQTTHYRPQTTDHRPCTDHGQHTLNLSYYLISPTILWHTWDSALFSSLFLLVSFSVLQQSDLNSPHCSSDFITLCDPILRWKATLLPMGTERWRNAVKTKRFSLWPSPPITTEMKPHFRWLTHREASLGGGGALNGQNFQDNT